MTEEQIYKKISDTYNSEKGKGFIIHLIRSFFPVHKSTYVLESTDKAMKCCITEQGLISKGEVIRLQLDGGVDEFIKHIKDTVRAETEGKEKPEHPLKEKLDGRVLAIGCEGSDKYLCQDSLEQLSNFITNELLRGNKHIDWLIRQEQGKEMINHMKEKKIIETQQEEKVIKKAIDKPKGMTLGDLGVLQQLKEKLEKDEKE